jgi:hypothetical protein
MVEHKVIALFGQGHYPKLTLKSEHLKPFYGSLQSFTEVEKTVKSYVTTSQFQQLQFCHMDSSMCRVFQSKSEASRINL